MTFQEFQQVIQKALPHDKCLHFIGGQVIAAITLPLGVWWSLGIVAAMAVSKEVYDRLHPLTDTCELLDAVATVCGGVPVWFIYLVR